MGRGLQPAGEIGQVNPVSYMEQASPARHTFVTWVKPGHFIIREGALRGEGNEQGVHVRERRRRERKQAGHESDGSRLE